MLICPNPDKVGVPTFSSSSSTARHRKSMEQSYHSSSRIMQKLQSNDAEHNLFSSKFEFEVTQVQRRKIMTMYTTVAGFLYFLSSQQRNCLQQQARWFGITITIKGNLGDLRMRRRSRPYRMSSV